MGTNLMRAMLVTSASVAMVATTAPTAAYAQEATYQIDIPAQSMGDALRALGKATKQNIVFSGSVVKGKRSAAVHGRMSADEALDRMLAGSGLKMSRGAGGGLVVVAGNADRGAAQPADLPSRPTAAQSGRASAQGVVVDARTDAALKGAIVEIVETGEKASTGALGQFRFPGKTGRFTVRISYLGYPDAEQVVDIVNGVATDAIRLSDGNAGGEIVVTAYQSARAQAINQERAAENSSTIISSDLLGDFSGSTISDALRRAPGVSFVRDNRTGDGTNIIVRGLEPNLNQVKLNGVVIPEGTGVGRAADLNNILADSIDKVTINKTLLPSQDNAGTGGLVEIETKSPLDRARRYASLTADTTFHGKGYGEEYSLSGTVSGKFGTSESFGVSASLQYRKQNISSRTQSTEMNYGEYLPIGPGGVPFEFYDLDPRIPFPYEEEAANAYPYTSNLGLNDVDQSTLSATLAAEWKIGTHTTLQADWVYTDLRSTVVSRAFRLFAPSSYSPDTFAGAPRNVLMYSGFASLSQTISESRTRNRTNSFSFRGETILDQFQIKYRAGYAEGKRKVPYVFSGSFSQSFGVSQSEIDPSLIDPAFGYAHAIFGPRAGSGAPTPMLTGAARERLYDTSAYAFTGATLTSNEGSNSILSAESSLRWSPKSSVLKYLEVGGSYRDSRFVNNASVLGSQDASFQIDPADPLTRLLASQLGVTFDDGEFGGKGYPLLSRDSVNVFYRNGNPVLNPLYTVTNIVTDPIYTQSETIEKELSAYVQANFTLGKVEAIGGVRMDHMNVDATYLSGPNIFDVNYNIDLDFQARARELIRDKVSGTNFLPRILVNYRPADNLVFRAGYYTTVARPAIRDLAARQDVTLYEAAEFGP
ncbi:MAG: TonB-dependent receptor domain-containing protein, partial [Sphingopyxis sp.]